MSHIRTHITLHYSNNMYTCKVLTGLLLKGTRPSWKSVYPKVGSGHVPFEFNESILYFYATAATVVIESSSFDEKEVLLIQNIANN